MQESDANQLKDLAHDHEVCYEVWPHVEFAQGKQIRTGFELQLCGMNRNGNCHQSPGCTECVSTFQDLRKIAGWIIPEHAEDARCEVQPYDLALHESRNRAFRPEVILNINILHRGRFDAPVDSAEEDCLKQMCGKLKALGIRRGN